MSTIYSTVTCAEIAERAEKFVEEILPQAGKIVIDVYNVNELLNAITIFKQHQAVQIDLELLIDWSRSAALLITKLKEFVKNSQVTDGGEDVEKGRQEILAYMSTSLAMVEAILGPAMKNSEG